MKRLLFITAGFVLVFVSPSAFSREQSILVRVTGYWRGEGSGQRAAWNGARLQPGHCAVDPKKIPYGSKVVFPDIECTAVDTGPSVVSRKSARYCGRTAAQKSALVVDRFFETKRDAVVWTNAHSQFITVRVITPDTASRRKGALANKNPSQEGVPKETSGHLAKAAANISSAVAALLPVN